jgi:ABC transporter substrate binding protein
MACERPDCQSDPCRDGAGPGHQLADRARRWIDVLRRDQLDLFRRAAGYVHRILQGTKPADLPVELARKFDLAVNLKTAKALGLELTPTFIARADEVIE